MKKFEMTIRKATAVVHGYPLLVNFHSVFYVMVYVRFDVTLGQM